MSSSFGFFFHLPDISPGLEHLISVVYAVTSFIEAKTNSYAPLREQKMTDNR